SSSCKISLQILPKTNISTGSKMPGPITLLYVVKTGCQWRQMPVNFPRWQSVHQQFRAWRDDGTWELAVKTLREHSRKARGRKATPTVAILDSQSAKTALKGGSAVTTRARK